MKTKIEYSCRNSVIELIVDRGTSGGQREVLAAMALFEDTDAWMLMDIRLRSCRAPSAFSCSPAMDAVCSSIKPGNEEDAALIRSQLREFKEDSEGIRWSSYDGLVRGPIHVASSSLAKDGHIGCHNKTRALSYLMKAHYWWRDFDGSIENATLPNPDRQPTESQVRALIAGVRNTSEQPELPKKLRATMRP